jgi:hypothetical protein
MGDIQPHAMKYKESQVGLRCIRERSWSHPEVTADVGAQKVLLPRSSKPRLLVQWRLAVQGNTNGYLTLSTHREYKNRKLKIETSNDFNYWISSIAHKFEALARLIVQPTLRVRRFADVYWEVTPHCQPVLYPTTLN